MKKIMFVFAVNTLASFLAHAEIIHSGDCTTFEHRNGCVENVSSTKLEILCSCPDNPPAPPPSFTGTRCSPPNHMTGDQHCCEYIENVQKGCWVR
ncbi:MAG: hypothetical protein ACXVCY_14225 [Pseudobdellovibrionaceae bacterium]